MSNQPKPRKLWGSPKVLLSADALIVQEKYYPLDSTRGAFVEVMPEVAPPPKAPPPPSTPWTTLKKILGCIALFFILIFAFLVSWDSDSNSAGGSGGRRNYRLVMVSNSGNVTALEHSNQKKLQEIASALNEALVARGITPDTGVYNNADAPAQN